MAAQTHDVRNELVLFSTDINKEKLELSMISCLIVCFWDIICTTESELIFIGQKSCVRLDEQAKDTANMA